MGTTPPSTSAKVARALGTSLGVLAGSVAIVAVLLGVLWLIFGDGGGDSMIGIIYVAAAMFGLPITYFILSLVAVSRAPEKRTASAFVGVLLIPIALVGVAFSFKSAQTGHEDNAKAVFAEFSSQLEITGTPLIYTEGREGCTLGYLTASNQHEEHEVGFDWLNKAVGTVGPSNGWNTSVAHVVHDRSDRADEEFSLAFSTREDAVVMLRTNYLTTLSGEEKAVSIVNVWAGECAENITLEQAADFGFGRDLVWSNELPTTLPDLWD